MYPNVEQCESATAAKNVARGYEAAINVARLIRLTPIKAKPNVNCIVAREKKGDADTPRENVSWREK